MANLTGKQSGTVTITSGNTSVTATPSSYTLANTILQYTYRGGFDRPDQGMVEGEKTDATTLTFERQVGTSGSCIIEWRLMEFDTDVVVQDISRAAPGATSDTITITAVTLARSFILSGGKRGSGGDFGNNEYQLFKFNSTTEIETQTESTWTTGEQKLQVVDFTGASVQEVVHSETTWTGTSSTDTITSVDTGKTWLISSYKTAASSSQFEENNFRVDLQSATQIRFLRDTGGSETFNWNYFVVEFTDGTTLQTGLHTVADTDGQDDITITAVTLAETSECLAGGDLWQNHGLTASATDDTRNAFFTAVLTTMTNLQVTRTATSKLNNLSWQVLEWNVAAAGGGFFTRRYYDDLLAGVA